MKRLTDSRLSHDAQVCMDAQIAVKQFIKDSYLRGVTWQYWQCEFTTLLYHRRVLATLLCWTLFWHRTTERRQQLRKVSRRSIVLTAPPQLYGQTQSWQWNVNIYHTSCCTVQRCKSALLNTCATLQKLSRSWHRKKR